MLRRVRCPAVSTARVAAPVLCARRGVSAEEQAEIDREAKLRQEIMKKKMQQAQSGSFFQRVQAQAELAQAQMAAMQQQKAQGGGAGAGANPWGAGQQPPHQTRMRTFSLGTMLWTCFIWSMALYLILAVWQMRKPQSVAMSWQGAPQWVIAPESTAAFFAVRTLLGSSRQRELQSEYEEFAKQTPSYSFYQWLTVYQPNALAGHSVSQAEFLAALASVARATGDGSWTKVFTRISRWGDDKSHVDTVMSNLRRDYPQHLNAPIGVSPAAGYGVPAGQQAMGYGGSMPSYNQGAYQQPQWGQQQQQQQQHWGQQQQQWGQQQQFTGGQQQQDSGNGTTTGGNGNADNNGSAPPAA